MHSGKRSGRSSATSACGLRPTRQRLALGDLLFEGEDRHVTAELLHAEAVRRASTCRWRPSTIRCISSSARVCCASWRSVAQRAYFDTNTSNHNHFFVEEEGELRDIPGDAIRVDGVPEPPDG